jgi:hypothetical protein
VEPERTVKTVVCTVAIAIIALIALLIGTTISRAEPPAPMQHHAMAPAPPEQCRVGDFLCDHDYFHPIYTMLELISGKTCCHNSEGRPTRDVKDATPAQIAVGFRYQVWVDGQWCPATANSLLKFSDTQRARLKQFPDKERLLQFLKRSHVFAPKSTEDPQTHNLICPHIYCLWENPDPS